MKKLSISEKIKIIEDVLENYVGERHLYMCNAIIGASLDYIEFNNHENDFLKENFSELCVLAEKYRCYNYDKKDVKFVFNGDVWFHGIKCKGLKISLLKELLELYKNQLD